MTQTKTFILKYDPTYSLERMLANLEKCWKGELKLVEPHIMNSNSIAALLAGFAEERLRLLQTLKQVRPANLEQLASYLQRNYKEVKRDTEILTNCGVVKLARGKGKIKPVSLYSRVVLELAPGRVFPINERNIKEINTKYNSV